MLTDFRYALRSLVRARGFVVLVVVSLGFALGVCTTMYGIIDAVLYPYVPYHEPHRVFRIYMLGDPRQERVTLFDRFEMLRSAGFAEDIAAITYSRGVVSVGTLEDQAYPRAVSANFFRLLGVSPALGRTFSEGNDLADAGSVVVSQSLWHRMFANRDAIGDATLLLDGKPFTVIGVMPRGMAYPFGTNVWQLIPAADMQSGRNLEHLWPVARLKPTVTEEQAQAALEALTARLTAQFGNDRLPFAFAKDSLEPEPAFLKAMHFMLAGSALIVLFIACANLANLMLVRGIARRRELALRLAIGASRIGLVRQLTAESVLLAVAGGTLGILAATWGMDVLINRMPPEIAYLGMLKPQLSWRVFAVAAAATAFTIVFFGLIPAWRASNVDVSEPLKESAGTTTGRVRGRFSPVIATEVALSVVLLTAAGLLVRAFILTSRGNSSFDPHNLYAIRADLTRSAFRGSGVPALDEQTFGALRRVEGVRAVAAVSQAAFDGDVVMSDFPGRVPRIIPAPLAAWSLVSADYLRTMGMRIAAGRDFEPGDRAGTGVAIVGTQTAKWLWPGMNPVGRMIKLGDARSTRAWIPVIGVTGSTDFAAAEQPEAPPEYPIVYVLSPSDSVRSRSFIVRVSPTVAQAPLHAARTVRMTLGLPGNLVPYPFDQRMQMQSRANRFLVTIFIVFGAFALLLVATGMHGVLALSVSQRQREFAVRIALGASYRDVFELVLRDGAVMVLVGVAAGTLLTVWTTQAFSAAVHGIPVDAGLWLWAAELVLGVAALASCVIPARRATRANPVDVLRAV